MLTERGDPGVQAIRYEITYAAAYLVLVEETLGSCSCSASVFRNSGSISRTWDWGEGYIALGFGEGWCASDIATRGVYLRISR